MVATFLDLNKRSRSNIAEKHEKIDMYEFPVHDCTQEQNGSPYFSSIVRQCKWTSSSRKIVEIQKFCYHGNLTSRFPLILGWVSWCERVFSQIVKQWACETILLCLLLPGRSLNLAVSSLLIIWNNATIFAYTMQLYTLLPNNCY